jgi:prolyl-tRNA editing enzyme YbaK/EbsC (Cys-tRNA(Pro) deacylase)
MSIDTVRAYFKNLGIENRILEFEESSATVEQAALALNVSPARISKTLSFKTDKGCMLIVCAGDARIDNRKFKDLFGFKAKMLSPEEVNDLVGHPVGGVCPFGIKPAAATAPLS